MGPFHRVPVQCESPMEYSTSGTAYFSGTPIASQVLPRKPVPAWASFSTRPLVLQEPALAWTSHRFTVSFRHLPALAWGPAWAGDGSLLHHGTPGAGGAQLPHHGPHPGLQGNLSTSVWSISSCSLFTDLGFCKVVSLTCSHSCFFWPQFASEM